MTVVKQIGVLSLARILAYILGILGIVSGIARAVSGTAWFPMRHRPWIGPHLGWLAIIVIPILYAAAGFVLGAITAWLYNIVAGCCGGVDLKLEEPKKRK